MREIFYLLVHFLKGCNSPCWVELKSGARNSKQVAGTQLLESSPAASQSHYQSTDSKVDLMDSSMHSIIGCGHPKMWLSLLYHIACPKCAGAKKLNVDSADFCVITPKSHDVEHFFYFRNFLPAFPSEFFPIHSTGKACVISFP